MWEILLVIWSVLPLMYDIIIYQVWPVRRAQQATPRILIASIRKKLWKYEELLLAVIFLLYFCHFLKKKMIAAHFFSNCNRNLPQIILFWKKWHVWKSEILTVRTSVQWRFAYKILWSFLKQMLQKIWQCHLFEKMWSSATSDRKKSYTLQGGLGCEKKCPS